MPAAIPLLKQLTRRTRSSAFINVHTPEAAAPCGHAWETAVQSAAARFHPCYVYQLAKLIHQCIKSQLADSQAEEWQGIRTSAEASCKVQDLMCPSSKLTRASVCCSHQVTLRMALVPDLSSVTDSRALPGSRACHRVAANAPPVDRRCKFQMCLFVTR